MNIATRIKALVPTEQEECANFWRWWRDRREEYPHVLIFCIDHGQRLTYGQIMKAKARGYEGGVCDYGVIVRGRGGMIEFKRTKGGTLKDDQKDFREAVIAAGGFWFLAKGAEAAKEFLRDNVLFHGRLGHGT